MLQRTGIAGFLRLGPHQLRQELVSILISAAEQALVDTDSATKDRFYIKPGHERPLSRLRTLVSQCHFYC